MEYYYLSISISIYIYLDTSTKLLKRREIFVVLINYVHIFQVTHLKLAFGYMDR